MERDNLEKQYIPLVLLFSPSSILFSILIKIAVADQKNKKCISV